MTSAFSGCGSSISPPRKRPSSTTSISSFQLQLSPFTRTVPVSRDYIAIKERELLEFERPANGWNSVAI